MTLNQILDIAIVLVGVYATLSCVCSWVNEKIASALRLRGWNLFKGVLALVDTHANAAAIFSHPLIASASPKSKQVVAEPAAAPNVLSLAAAAPNMPPSAATVAPAVPATTSTAGGLKGRVLRFLDVFQMKPPSYVDARNFSTAVWQVLADANAAALKTTVAAVNARRAAAVPPLPAVPAPAGATGTEQLALLIAHAPGEALAALTEVVQAMPDGDLKRQLSGLLTQAGKDFQGLLAATDGWFNAQMDRVSGWYKREIQWVLTAITFFVVTLTGVDTVEVLKILSATDAGTLATIAQSVDPQAASNVLLHNAPATGPAPFDVTKFVHVVTPHQSIAANWLWNQPVAAPHGRYYRWPGMVVTFLALLLGGTFWFDALKSLANVRSAGRKPERSDQPPK